jgi:NAD(P)H dehydrogenase (quinone)
MGITVVSGASGRVGGRVAARWGDRLRLLVRDAARAPRIDGAETAVASYGDRAALRAALTGASAVLMISAAETPDRVDQHKSFVDAAMDAEVEHLVYTSFVGAAPDAVFTLARDHWATEEYIKESGIPYTFLRDNLYADFVPLLAGADGVIRGPAGNGRAAVVSQDDVADSAVAVLRETGAHSGRTYELTGPEALSFDEMAAVVTQATGRETRFQNETLEQAYASRASYGAPSWQVDAWVSTYTAVAAGVMSTVDPAVERLTGRPAMRLVDTLRR